MFNCTLGSEMKAFLEIRTLTVAEKTVLRDRYILSALDQYLTENGFSGKILDEEVLITWINSLSGQSKTVKEKILVLRVFVKYLNSLGNPSYLPPLPRVKTSYIPYIYSDDELAALIHYADNLPVQNPNICSSFLRLKIPMAIRIIYGCGTRLGETMALKRKDIDFDAGTLHLRNTKFSKERVIPVHESLLVILKRYCLVLGIMNTPDAYLFPGQKQGSHFTTRQMDTWFSEILKLADIDQREKIPYERGACLHCLRHLFVLKSMQQLEKAGHSVNMNDLLLPTYLGHEHLLDTDQYMRFSGVQVYESLNAFETFTAGLIPEIEVLYEEE